MVKNFCIIGAGWYGCHIGLYLKELGHNVVIYEKERKIIQKAVSHIKILKSNDQYTLLELKPITGRKHQLRKQLYNIGHSIIGDDKYYVKKDTKFVKSKNLMLHAYEIKFMIKNVKYNFKANLSDSFKEFLDKKNLNIF